MFCCCGCFCCCRDPNQKFTLVRQKRLFGLAFATINFELFVRMITWSIITIMIQWFHHYRKKQRWTNIRRKKQKTKKKRTEKTSWKHNQAEFVTLQSDIWPFTSIFRFGPINGRNRIPNVFALLNLVGPFAPKLLFNYDICLLFHLMCGFLVVRARPHNRLTLTPMAIVRQFETTWIVIIYYFEIL